MGNFGQFEYDVISKATLLDIELDECLDPQEYNDLLEEYRNVFKESEFFEKIYDWQVEESLQEEQPADIYEENGKYGLRASSFFSDLPPIYDSIEQIDNSNLLKVCYKGKYGMMECFDDMRISVPLEYDSIDIYPEDELVVVVGKDSKFQCQCHGESEWVDEVIMPVYAGWVRVRQGNRMGWLDSNLRVTYNPSLAHLFFIKKCVDCKYVSNVNRDMLNRWTDWEEKYRTSPEDLKIAFDKEPEFFSTLYYKNPTMYTFEADGKMGVKDSFNTVVVPAIYDEIEISRRVVESTCQGRLGDRWGMVVYSGNAVRNPRIEFDEPAHRISSLYGFAVKKNGKFGLYDNSKDSYLLDPIYDEFIKNEDYDHIITRIGDKYGFYDLDFNVFPQFDDYRFGRWLSFVRFKKDGKWGYIDGDGEWTEHIEEARAYVENEKCL